MFDPKIAKMLLSPSLRVLFFKFKTRSSSAVQRGMNWENDNKTNRFSTFLTAGRLAKKLCLHRRAPCVKIVCAVFERRERNM